MFKAVISRRLIDPSDGRPSSGSRTVCEDPTLSCMSSALQQLRQKQVELDNDVSYTDGSSDCRQYATRLPVSCSMGSSRAEGEPSWSWTRFPVPVVKATSARKAEAVNNSEYHGLSSYIQLTNVRLLPSSPSLLLVSAYSLLPLL